MNIDSRNRAAAHEAGHALVGHVAGHLIERAFVGDDPESVIPADTADGATALHLTGDWRNALLIGVAGWCAEEVSFPGDTADRGHDLVFCTGLLSGQGFTDWQSDAFIELASTEVRGWLSNNRPCLDAIADWLSRHGDIDSETLAALIQAHGVH